MKTGSGPSSAKHLIDRVGLNDSISRRDFVNGVLLTGAGLLLHGKAPAISPADAFNGYGGEVASLYQGMDLRKFF